MTIAARIKEALSDGNWWPTGKIREHLGCGPGTDIPRRIRDLRSPQHGSNKIQTRKIPGRGGSYEYRLVVNDAPVEPPPKSVHRDEWRMLASHLGSLVRDVDGAQSEDWKERRTGLLDRLRELYRSEKGIQA